MESGTIAPPATGRSEEEQGLAQQAQEADGTQADLEGSGPEEQGPPTIELLGNGQLSLKIGGGRPDVATAKLKGGKMDIPQGEFQPGDIVEAVVRMRCTEVGIHDKTNHMTGEVNERERRHGFHLLSIEKVEHR